MKKLFPLLFLLGCGSPQISTLDGLAASGSGNNVALIFGSPHGLGGVPTDVKELSALLAKPDFHFRVVSNGSASTAEIFQTVQTEAATADSLLWYFSGHGNTGVMLADDRTFAFQEVADKLKAARHNKPLDRLLVLIDSCYSGSFVDGNGDAIVTEPGAETGSHRAFTEAVYQPLDRDTSLYKQAFVFSASKNNETSEDLGSEKGGAFTYTFRTVMGKMMTENPMVKFRDFAEEVSKETAADYDHTPMWRGFPKADVMDDYLFLYRAAR